MYLHSSYDVIILYLHSGFDLFNLLSHSNFDEFVFVVLICIGSVVVIYSSCIRSVSHGTPYVCTEGRTVRPYRNDLSMKPIDLLSSRLLGPVRIMKWKMFVEKMK